MLPHHIKKALRWPQQRLARLWDTGSVQKLSLMTLKLRMLKVLLGFGSAALLVIWIFEGSSGRLIAFDQFAYPIMLLVYVSSFAIVSFRPQLLPILEKLSFATLATYAVTYTQVFIYTPQLIDGYSLASFMQWFPLVYTSAYVFLEERQALGASVAIYLSLMLGVGLRTILVPAAIWESESGLLLINMLSAHPVYIAVLSVFALLKSWFAKAQTHAEVMSEAASIDYLTGAANRRAASDALQRELSAALRGGALAVLLLDIDHFKRVNDSFGHDVGDHALIETTALIRAHLRSSDTLGRWGGEEFIVVAGGLAAAEAIQLAERLRVVVASHAYQSIPGLTISCGVAAIQPLDTPDTLVKRADTALYRAKQLGRDRVEAAEECDQTYGRATMIAQ